MRRSPDPIDGAAPAFRRPAMRNALAAIVALATLALTWKATKFGSVVFDDDTYVFDNGVVLNGLTRAGVRWAFGFHASNWHPLTWLSHMADVSMFGPGPERHHLTSILIHAVSAGLLLIALDRLTSALWESTFVAALFAVHPLHVESYAWIAERKDVLCGFFFMLSLLAWARYVEQPRAGRYALVVVPFVLGLLSKPMIVTLPMVLLILDFWPLRRAVDARSWRRVILEKIPLAMLAAADGVITLVAQRQGVATALARLPRSARLENALVASILYLRDFVWPSSLAILYPFQRSIATAVWMGSAIVFASLSAFAWIERRRLPYVMGGWLWYLVMLLPVIGIVQVGSQSRADRYTYLPLIGICIAISWSGSELIRRLHLRPVHGAVAALAILAAFSIVTARQLETWRSAESVFTHALESGHESSIAHLDLGVALGRDHRIEEAIPHFRRAIEIAPDDPDAYIDLGEAFTLTGRLREAVPCWEAALHLEGSNAPLLNRLGALYARLGEIAIARSRFEHAVRIDPQFLPAILNSAQAAAMEGDIVAASAYTERALAIDPENQAARRLAIRLHRTRK